jgi:hypothetical protein
MTPRCPQTLDNGQRCSALAINGSKFCRHHDPQCPPRPAKEEPPESEPLILPPLVDKPSILAALNEVVQALAGGRIKRSVADTLLSAIKLANRLLTEIEEAGLTVLLPQQPSRQMQASQHAVARLAASGESREPIARFSPNHHSSTRFVNEMMAQAHELLGKSARPDPNLMRP